MAGNSFAGAGGVARSQVSLPTVRAQSLSHVIETGGIFRGDLHVNRALTQAQGLDCGAGCHGAGLYQGLKGRQKPAWPATALGGRKALLHPAARIERVGLARHRHAKRLAN
jgi:hypothetical protein